MIELPVWQNGARGLDYVVFRQEYLRREVGIAATELTVVPVDTNEVAPVLVRGGACICHTDADKRSGGIWALEDEEVANFRRILKTTSGGVAVYPPPLAT